MFESAPKTKPVKVRDEIDFSVPIELWQYKDLVLEGYFLQAYDEKTKLTNDDIKVTYYIKGVGPVYGERRPEPWYDKDTKKLKGHSYNRFTEDIVADEIDAAKKANPKDNIHGRALKGFLKFFVTKATWNYKNDKGVDVPKTVEYNKAGIVSLNLADVYFSVSTTGVARTLTSLWKEGKLKDNKIQLTNGDIEATEELLKTDPQKKAVEAARKGIDEVANDVTMPITYDEFLQTKEGKIMAKLAGKDVVETPAEDNVADLEDDEVPY
jgi:hypothetical protein